MLLNVVYYSFKTQIHPSRFVFHWSNQFKPPTCHLSIHMSDTATKRRRGRVLTPQQVIDIFLYKITTPAKSHATVRPKQGNDCSILIGKIYNVSAKTIRDIWNRRSWRRETFHLWHLMKRYHNMHDQSVDHTQSTDSKLSATSLDTHTSWNYLYQETLPASSSDEDPFHDDWPYWNMPRETDSTTEYQIVDFIFFNSR